MEQILAGIVEQSIIAGAFVYMLHYMVGDFKGVLGKITATLEEVSLTMTHMNNRMENMENRIEKIEQKG